MTQRSIKLPLRLRYVAVLIILILVPTAIYGAVATNIISVPLITRAPDIGGGNIAGGVIPNVPPTIESFEPYNTIGPWTNAKLNVAAFNGILKDRNGYQDIDFLNITIYDPYLRYYTSTEWRNDGSRLGPNPGIIPEGVDSRNFVRNNGRIFVWHDEIDRSDSDGYLYFMFVYSFGQGIVPGTYSIDVFAGDENETVGEYIIDYTVFIDGEETLHLHKGWNLISLPLYPTTPLKASTLLSMIPSALRISGWDPNTQRYITYLKNAPMFDFDIMYGTAYFIKVHSDVEITFTGTENDESAPPIRPGDDIRTANYNPPGYVNHIKKGWNVASVPHHLAGISVYKYLTEYTHTTYLALWDGRTQRFQVIQFTSEEASTTHLAPGQGFFIYMQYDTSLDVPNVRALNPGPQEV